MYYTCHGMSINLIIGKFFKKKTLSNNMDFCCRLGDEYNLKKNVLYESEHFFVVPTIGQMGIEGYLLLCSKKHYLGMGNIPKEYLIELEDILRKTKEIISKIYDSKVLVFEHGPKSDCHNGGGCLDHGHLHIVPTSLDIVPLLTKSFELEEINDFSSLAEISKAKKYSYMFIETQTGKRYVVEIKSVLPSQYLRQLLALKMGINNWDWKINPDYETFEKTIQTLKDKF